MKTFRRLQYARWAVKENYFGVFENTRIICTCTSLDDAAYIIDNLVENHKGRTIEYIAERIDDLEDETFDEEIIQTWDGQKNLKKYKIGISCLINN